MTNVAVYYTAQNGHTRDNYIDNVANKYDGKLNYRDRDGNYNECFYEFTAIENAKVFADIISRIKGASVEIDD